MHIPDGYLSPGTSAVFYAVMAPVWYVAFKKAEKTLKLRQLPVLALGAAFTFVIMMFNIPIPGGSSGHMVGSAVVATVLGPWAGVVAMSLALTIQAFVFADGGVTALGANCFNMGLVMSFSGYFVYRALAAGGPSGLRRFVAAAAAGYVSVNLAALAAGLELGVQPLIAHASNGQALYAPYPLHVAIPAMTLPHLLFFGPVEALGTALVVSYVHRTDPELLKGSERSLGPLWAALAALVVLTPLGLLATGTPWGEWDSNEVSELVGFVPAGMERLGELWRGVMPGYTVTGAGGVSEVLFYIASALLGSVAMVLFIYIWGRRWRHE